MNETRALLAREFAQQCNWTDLEDEREGRMLWQSGHQGMVSLDDFYGWPGLGIVTNEMEADGFHVSIRNGWFYHGEKVTGTWRVTFSLPSGGRYTGFAPTPCEAVLVAAVGARKAEAK